MLKLSFSTSCVALALCISPAAAADLPVKAPVYSAPAPATFANRWYVEARVGGPLKKNYDINTLGLGAGTYKPSSGLHGAFDIGVEFTPNWRAELELTWTRGKDGSAVFGATTFPHTGSTNVYTIGVNGFYVFNFNPTIRPYVGAGVGIARYSVNNLGAVGGTFVIDDSDTAVTGALHLGVDFMVTPSVAITGRYTFAYTGSLSFASNPTGSTTSRGSETDNVFSGGLRVYLN
ncbi:MAG: outer membrane protein [Pseudolabrys sp.]